MSNPVHHLHMGRRGRTSGPREKRGGISLPVHLWDFIDELVELRTAAYEKMGGETKQSTSDELALAVEEYAVVVQKEFGPFPNKANRAEREQFIQRMADKMAKQLRDDLLQAS